MGNENSRLGVTGSNASDLGSMGALYPILTQLGGGSKAGQMAMDYAQQMYPDAPKADPWEAALQYFLAMGQAASEPGATLLGSGVRAMQAPADYLAAKKTEKRETDRARMQTALQLAPSLKPPAATKAGYTNVTVDGIAQVMTPTEIQAAKAAGKVVAPYSSTSTSVDNTRMDVILKGVTDDPNTTIDERVTSILRSAFDETKHLPASALPKNSSTSEDKTRMNVILRNTTDDPATPIDERIISILRSDYDETKHLPTESLPEQKLPLQGSAPERMSSRVYDFVDAYISNPEVEPRLLAQFLDDVSSMGKPQIITFVENNVTKTATNPGKDAYRIIAESYGQELADKIKALSQTQQSSIVPLSELTDEDDENKQPETETIVIAGREFTVVSSAPKNIPKEAAQGIVDARGGMRDVKIASDLIFPDGVFNRGLVIASNVMPGGGVGPEGSLTGDSRTAYQAMKRSIELLLRARSGAAVPPAEVENYMTLYYPSSFDNEAQARNKLAVLAQYFTDTNQLLSQGKLLYDPTIPESDRKYDPNKHGIPVDSSASGQAAQAPTAITVVDEYEISGVKYKQLSDGRIIAEE
jgi:hypothetical protein